VAKNSALYVKRATIATLKTADDVTVLVAAARIFPMQRPAVLERPWIGYGAPINSPFGASCMDGSETNVALHNFTETTGEGAATKSGEDTAHKINAAVEAALDGRAIDLTDHGCPYEATAHFTTTGSQVMQDGNEADKFHGFVNLRVSVSS
jgi:hypothetical protein